MAIRLGLDARLYRNTGNPGSLLFELVENVRDLTLNLETGEADVTTRGNAGWRASLGTLKDASIEFEMVWNSEDVDFVVFKDAFFAGDPIELLVMDGEASSPESQGLQALCQIISFTRSEALEEAITVSVTAKPTYSGTPPAWVLGPIEFDA
ncbi:MAG: phage tail protein [Planctomycetes bacterium]|nr:phage tail protein [Planctomycetota bacterium]